MASSQTTKPILPVAMNFQKSNEIVEDNEIYYKSVSKKTEKKDLSILDKIEQYVKDKTNVGILKACQDLNLEEQTFQQFARASRNISFDREFKTVTWKTEPI